MTIITYKQLYLKNKRNKQKRKQAEQKQPHRCRERFNGCQMRIFGETIIVLFHVYMFPLVSLIISVVKQAL